MVRKSAVLRIGIPLKGLNTNKSSSPVMIQDALDATASSGNLLSLVSRHILMSMTTSIQNALAWNSFIADSLCTKGKYFSNFERTMTSANSSNVLAEYNIIPELKALLYARLFLEFSKMYAQIIAFVSMTNVLITRLQQIIKDIFCKSIAFRFITKLIKEPFVIFRDSIVNHFFQCQCYSSIKLAFCFRAKFTKCYRSWFIYSNDYLFHDFTFFILIKDTKYNT